MSWHITPLYFFSSTIIYFAQKEPINVQILRLSSVESKFPKFLMSFFKAQVSSSSNFASFFSAMTDNSSVLFWLNTFEKSSYSKNKFSDLPLLALKFTKFLVSFLETRVSFSSNFGSLCSVMRHNFSVLFHLNIICFGQNEPIIVQIFRLSTAWMKINQIPYVIFQAASQLSFKFCITFQCHDA